MTAITANNMAFTADFAARVASKSRDIMARGIKDRATANVMAEEFLTIAEQKGVSDDALALLEARIINRILEVRSGLEVDSAGLKTEIASIKARLNFMVWMMGGILMSVVIPLFQQ